MGNIFLCPGQGAQYPGMAKDLFETSSTVRFLFEQASEVLKKDMRKLLFEGTEAELKSTENTQVAVVLASISAAAVLREAGLQPQAILGFSVGEYSAMHEAGVLDTETLFRIVAIRGEVMEKGSRLADDASGPSAMTAVLGLDFDEASEAIRSLNADNVFIANHSSPSQIVLAGKSAGLDKAEAILTEKGAMRVVRLKVSGPFHSPLLNSARSEFEERIQHLKFNDPKIPIISNVSALPLKSADEARKRAGEQIVSMVRWVESEQYLFDSQTITTESKSRIFEVGPGKVLAGLWKSFNKTLKVEVAGKLEEIQSIIAA